MIIQRNSVYYLRRRVPKKYRPVEPREVVWISLQTDSKMAAEALSPLAWLDLLAQWDLALNGEVPDPIQRYQAARRLAKGRGFSFLPAKDVAELPTEDLLGRVEAVTRQSGDPDPVAAAAILGGVKEPPIKLSGVVQAFFDLERENRTQGKNQRQIAKWEAPRKKAIENFMSVVGDKPLPDISPEDLIEYRRFWMDRVKSGAFSAETANKEFWAVNQIIEKVSFWKSLGVKLPFNALPLRVTKKGKRASFSVEWIRTRIMAPGALDGLDTQARCLVLGMINTGYRPSEAEGLLPARIRLDVQVPHIEIAPDIRELKTESSARVIPLVGISLEAFKECPDGFPDYREKDKASKIINEYFTEKGLRETPKHTLYSLRHSFEDRMKDAKVDESVRRDLFGHTINRPDYGRGNLLGLLNQALNDIAL